jgi:ferrous iron transport protein A
LTLLDLHKNQKAIIESIASKELHIKMMEMGLYVGQEVEFLLRAPFGDPIAINVSGYTLSLRKFEAEAVKVKLK